MDLHFEPIDLDRFWHQLKPKEQTRIYAKAKWNQIPWIEVLIEWPDLVPLRSRKSWNAMVIKHNPNYKPLTEE